jgi:pimeloyl-ACP methyl ester carboxylesterase
MEAPGWMLKVTHKTVKTNGINMHVVEQGTGPTVLLLHGFPDCWYSWRYQIPALADAGFHVLAPDLRGYGETDAPKDQSLYTTLHIVGDIVGMLDALGETKPVFVVCHDWGAYIGWDLCLFRPDRVKAIVGISVPYMPTMPGPSSRQQLTEQLGEGFYQNRFQEPGRAERDFAKTGTKLTLQKFMYAGAREIFCAPPDQELTESIPPPPPQPSWITDFDIDYYTKELDRSGWTGGLNYYRNMDKNHELKAPWLKAKLTTTALFVAGSEDIVLKFPSMKDYIYKDLKTYVPNLKDIVVLDGGHFIHQEQGDQLNKVLLAFFLDHTA